MEELIPVGFGLLLGLGLGAWLRPARLPVGAAAAVALGVLATVVTGEASLSWSYVLIDVPLVAVSTTLGLLMVRRAMPRYWAPRRSS